MIIAGIDEAGLGPLLGPLVVTATAFSVPDETADVPLWDSLAPAVSRKPSRRLRSVAIGDSKKLHSRASKAPLAHLERAVLAMLATRDRKARDVKELLAILAPEIARELPAYPWYDCPAPALPRQIGAMDASFAGNAISAAMAQAGAALETIRCEVVLAGEFNRLVAATRNKATAAFGVTCRLLAYLWDRFPRHGAVRIFADRQGGRRRHLSALQRVFPACRMRIVEESERTSSYMMMDGPREAMVSFSVGAEELHLATALASMASKYLRELMMEMFNDFWRPLVPGLAPTAGYYTDGRRFLGEIEPAIERLGVGRELILRSR